MRSLDSLKLDKIWYDDSRIARLESGDPVFSELLSMEDSGYDPMEVVLVELPAS
jgi:hypothetical protein